MPDFKSFVVGKSDCKLIEQFYGNDFDEVRLTLHRDICFDMAKTVVSFNNGNAVQGCQIMVLDRIRALSSRKKPGFKHCTALRG